MCPYFVKNFVLCPLSIDRWSLADAVFRFNSGTGAKLSQTMQYSLSSTCCESFGSAETCRCWISIRFRVQGHMFLQTDIGFFWLHSSLKKFPSSVYFCRCCVSNYIWAQGHTLHTRKGNFFITSFQIGAKGSYSPCWKSPLRFHSSKGIIFYTLNCGSSGKNFVNSARVFAF